MRVGKCTRSLTGLQVAFLHNGMNDERIAEHGDEAEEAEKDAAAQMNKIEIEFDFFTRMVA